MQRVERVLLYALMLLLVLASGFIVWTTWDYWNPSDPIGTVPPAPPTDLTGLHESIATLSSSLADHNEGVSKKLAEIAKALRAIGPGICEPPPKLCPELPPTGLTISSTFTLLYENARLETDKQLTKGSAGIRLAPRHEQRLEMIERAFRPCQADGTETVAFVVTGFSSTAVFERDAPTGGRESMPNSDDLNVQTANLRAEVVEARLRNAGFKVTRRPDHWESIDQLRRPYLDDAQPGTDQQALNRSVYIEVSDAGACDLRRVPLGP